MKNFKDLLHSFSGEDLIFFQRMFLGLLFIFLIKNGYETCAEVRFHQYFTEASGLMKFIPQVFLEATVFQALYITLTTLCFLSLIFPLRWFIITPVTILYVLCMGVSETIYSTFNHHFFHVKSTLIAPLMALTLASFLNKEELKIKSWKNGIPIIFTHFMLAMIYLGPNLKRFTKNGFPGWYDGETLRVYLLESSILFSSPLSLQIAQIAWLCMLLQIFVLIIESGFWLGFFNNKLLRYFLLGALCFHLGVELLMKANYLDYFLCLFTIFLTRPYRERISLAK